MMEAIDYEREAFGGADTTLDVPSHNTRQTLALAVIAGAVFCIVVVVAAIMFFTGHDSSKSSEQSADDNAVVGVTPDNGDSIPYASVPIISDSHRVPDQQQIDQFSADSAAAAELLKQPYLNARSVYPDYDTRMIHTGTTYVPVTVQPLNVGDAALNDPLASCYFDYASTITAIGSTGDHRVLVRYNGVSVEDFSSMSITAAAVDMHPMPRCNIGTVAFVSDKNFD